MFRLEPDFADITYSSSSSSSACRPQPALLVMKTHRMGKSLDLECPQSLTPPPSPPLADGGSKIPLQHEGVKSAAAQGTKRVVLLVSSFISTSTGECDQRRALNLLHSKGIDCRELDGADPVNKETRTRMFALSGHHAVYPQIFLEDVRSGELSFVGIWAEVQSLVDMNDLPPELLAQNPTLPTFDRLFACVEKGPAIHALSTVW